MRWQRHLFRWMQRSVEILNSFSFLTLRNTKDTGFGVLASTADFLHALWLEVVLRIADEEGAGGGPSVKVP